MIDHRGAIDDGDERHRTVEAAASLRSSRERPTVVYFGKLIENRA